MGSRNLGRTFRPFVPVILAALAFSLTACHKISSMFGKHDSPTTVEGGSNESKGVASNGTVSSPSKVPAAPLLPTISTKTGAKMVLIPAGQFMMGSDEGNPDERPVHKVSLHAFFMDVMPVTGAMFAKVQMPNPSHWQENPNLPVETVRWRDAKTYCNERSRKEGLKPCYNEKTKEWDCDYTANGYRLPTEAEWEYAARAGAPGPYDFGEKNDLKEYAWCALNSDRRTHTVGTKKPNKWGLYDMYGNVSVWCEDVYDEGYYQSSPPNDPHGPPSPGNDVRRVIRGGSWRASPNMCRATYRQAERTGDTDACFHTDYCGLRCVRNATSQEVAQFTGGKPATNP